MQQIEAIGAVQGAAGAGASPLYLAMDQPSSVVSELMQGANVLAQAELSLPPTPAALLDISPAAAGLIEPVITLSNHRQLLLLGEQSLEMIYTDSAPAVPPPPSATPSAPGQSGSSFDAFV